MTSAPGRRRVLVLGGGAAGLAAAFELSDPAQGGRYDVTVMSLGWRLGGKGASGRNAARHQRIEEHGLHLWFGFYEEALDLMRRAYAAAGADAPAPSAAHAFAPVAWLGLWDRRDAPGSRWRLPLPARALEDRAPGPIGPGDYVTAIARWLLAVWGAREDRFAAPAAVPPPPLVAAARPADGPFDIVSLEGRAALLDEASVELEGTGLRLLAQLCDFWAGVLRRAVACGAIDGDGGFDPAVLAALDAEDFRAWLAPGLRWRETLGAPFLRALYDLIFAYEEGDRDRPGAAAGMALRNLFRIAFEHRGSLMLRMRGGMGDVVFGPLYHALRRRGVRIELFRAVTGLGQRDGAVDRVDVVDQVDLTGGGYDPLEQVGSVWAWPSEPRWSQIAGGADLRDRGVDLEREHNPLGRAPRRLRRGEDFDDVVLAIPVGALRPLCGELTAAHPPFERMLDAAATVPTQAVQLWLTAPAPDAGLVPAPGAVSGAYDPPFDTCVDFGHLIALEDWPPEARVAQIAYACGVLDAAAAADPDPVARQRAAQAAVERAVRAFADHPAAEELRGALADREGRPGGAVEDQYWRANVAGAEQYVLSLPGSPRHRLAPGASGFGNLALAGDWTRTAVGAGCVEAAVASGRRAAAALGATGVPA